jgi:hypothetical protein
MPRFMIIVKANEQSEAGVMPSEEVLAAMGRYNEELAKAGVMLAGEGLHPSSKGARVAFGRGGSTRVIDGPFAETKELIAGFWLIQARSMKRQSSGSRKAPFGQYVEGGQYDEAVIERSARSSRTRTSAPSSRPSYVSRRRAYASRPRQTAASRASCATSAWPRTSRRTRWSPRSSGGRSPASRTTRAPG